MGHNQAQRSQSRLAGSFWFGEYELELWTVLLEDVRGRYCREFFCVVFTRPVGSSENGKPAQRQRLWLLLTASVVFLNLGFLFQQDDLHRLTKTALKNIIDSSNVNVERARSEYEHEMRSLVQQIYDEVMSFIKSSDVRSFQDNVTNIFTRFIGEVESTWNASEIENDSEKMLKKLIKDAFAKRKIPEGSEVFHWKGSSDKLIRDFWEDVRSFGGDPERNVSSLYDLTETFVMDAVDFGDKTIKQVTKDEYNVSSLGEAILKALRGGNENDEFDREVIEKEISTLIRGVAELYMVYDVNAGDFVHKVIGWVQSRLDRYSDGSIQKIPGKAFVSPLILLDFVLEKVCYYYSL